MKAWFAAYPLNLYSKDFTVIVQDSCEIPVLTPGTGSSNEMVLTPGSLADETYLIHSGAQVTPDFGDFLLSPVYCPISYSMAISPSLPLSDPNGITLDAVARTVTFDSNDKTSENTYTVTITALTPLGADSGVSFSF